MWWQFKLSANPHCLTSHSKQRYSDEKLSVAATVYVMRDNNCLLCFDLVNNSFAV